MAGIDRLPRLFIQLQIQAGQHHPALRQAGDHAQQVSGGGNGADGADGHHQMIGRGIHPAAGERFEKAIAPVGRVDEAAFLKVLRPGVEHDGEEAQRHLPVFGQRVRHGFAQLPGVHPLDDQLIERAGQRRCQPVHLGGGRVCPPLRYQPGPNEAGEFHLPLDDADGGRNVGFRREVVDEAAERFVFVHIAEGGEARQERGPRLALANERLAHGAGGAAVGQEDLRLGQRQRIAVGERIDAARD